MKYHRAVLLPLLLSIGIGFFIPSSAQETASKPPILPNQTKPQIGPAEGYLMVPWDQADQHYNKLALVYGKVVLTKKTDWRCYLNFHKDWKNHFTVTIDKCAFSEFNNEPEKFFSQKIVAVHGQIQGLGARPEMAVTNPQNILIVPQDTADVATYLKSRFQGLQTPQEYQAAQKPRENNDTVRIATYNILNLFDEYDDPYRIDEVMKTKPREQLEKIAQQIRVLNADVIALQEVENRFYLQRFIRAFLSDMGYEHVALIEGNNPRGIDVAVVSRFPIGPVTSYQNLRFKGPDGRVRFFQRDLLRVSVHGPGDFDFEVFSVHLKSKGGSSEASELVRQAEATKIREIVDDILYRDPQAKFVVCGDFNDLWDSPSLKIIRGTGQTKLSCPGSSLKQEQQTTYNKKPHRSMIDFLMCSPRMQSLYSEGSYSIIPGTVENSGSDHNPSVATFKIH